MVDFLLARLAAHFRRDVVVDHPGREEVVVKQVAARAGLARLSASWQFQLEGGLEDKRAHLVTVKTAAEESAAVRCQGTLVGKRCSGGLNFLFVGQRAR